MPFGKNAAQQRVSQVHTEIAPLGGLDDIDPIANMDSKFCISLVNWFPGNAALSAREGYSEWATNMTKPIRTIMPYRKMSGDNYLFASTDTSIYDVTSQSAAPPVVFATTNGYYKFTIFGNNYFQYLVATNGEHTLLYDGTTWKAFTEVATPGQPGEINGVNPSKFSNVTVYQKRLWFVEENSMTAWYCPLNTAGGVAKPFYLSGVFKKGGKLTYMVDWSVDGGDGLNNKLVFMSSAGEVAVYVGTDPADDTKWTLEAVFYAAPPLGERSFTDFGGDVFMVTTTGLIPLTKVLMGLMSESPYEQALTKRISRTINRIVVSRKYATNWEVLNMPTLQSIMVFVPPFGIEPPIQFVMNSLTGAWTRYDLPANCAQMIQGELFFGTVDGRVMKFGDVYYDEIKLGQIQGTPIQCNLFSAYNYMEHPTTLKHWKLLRPLFQAKQPPNYLFHLNTDFQTEALPGSPAPPAGNQVAPLWDQAIWDAAYWSSAFTTFRPWVGPAALGFCCALLMKVTVTGPTTLVAVEYVYEEGAVV